MRTGLKHQIYFANSEVEVQTNERCLGSIGRGFIHAHVLIISCQQSVTDSISSKLIRKFTAADDLAVVRCISRPLRFVLAIQF